jgi:hypothetical protein
MNHPEKRLSERYGIKDPALIKRLTRRIKNRSPKAELVKMLPGHAALFEIHARGKTLYPVFDLKFKRIKTFLPAKGVKP